MIGLGSTIWIVSLFYGPIKDLYSDLEYKRCQKNWWTSLLFINNHYNQHDMCYFITWYLAADTQLYVISLIILSMIWKFKHKTKLILSISVLIGILIPTAISYVYNLDVIYRLTPESFDFNAIYSSTYANMATYMVGICFGYIYFQKKNYNIFNNLLHKLIWWVAFIGLPILVVLTSSYYYSRLYSAIMSGILKPLYALGIGIGVLGMSQKIGGLMQKVCEWKPAIFMGNFTYSTYVVHYGIVFYRTATAKQPLYVSDFVIITSFMYDAVLSFLCGFLMHIFVEMPSLQLQKMLVPQVRRQRTANDSKNK
ncbi:hypothetical protein NQ314_020570 [Rhamnusium bicolor]|uniref:Acyltransferase 3 domain-containing protein n=1 Tax=Rhamnusium bicolor TaxID=1586634 RepID=A0AAV8WL36_9CUCU|nr:hypothetical protein NQ314_020570 [Rhamnusium bicolor]